MAEDDFQKGSPNDKTNLGLRDAISNARQNNQNLAEKRALELFKEMNIIDKVTSAINSGSSSVTISFPATVKKKKPDDRFVGEEHWEDVMDYFVSLFKGEVDEITIITELLAGGCCKKPWEESGTRTNCRNCGKRCRMHNERLYTNIRLSF